MQKTASLIACVMLLALAGCRASNTSNPNTTDPAILTEKQTIEITVITSYGVDDGNRLNYEKAVNAYQDETGYIVRDESGNSNEEWKTRVTARFNDNTEPDILFYFTGVDANTFVEAGKVVPLDEIRAVYPEYAANMREDMMGKSPVDGNIYAVPVNGYWEGLFVNKKVVQDCGVSIPDANTTWEAFLADCQTIAEKGYIPITVSLQTVPHYWFEYSVFNNGDTDSHTLLPLSSSDTIGQHWAAGLYDIKDLYERGFFPPNTTTATHVETDVLMTDYKAAFMIEGSWKLGWFAENAADINDFTVTYVPGRGARKSTEIVGGLSMGYYITRKAWDDPEKQAACVAFVTAMTTDDVVATFGETAVTALKNGVTPSPDASSLVKDALEMVNHVTAVVAATEDGLLANARGDLFANISRIVTGDMTAEDAIDRCLAIKE